MDQYYCHDPHSNGSQILWSMRTNITVTILTPMAVKFCGVSGTNITVTILTPMAVKFCGVCGPILLSRSSLQWQSNFVEYVDQYYCHDPHSNGSQILWSMWDQYYCHDPHSNGSKILWSMWTNITVTILTPMAVKFCGVSGTNITVTILTPMAVKFCGVCGPILLSRSSLQWQSNFVELVGPILLSRSSLQWQSNFVELVGPILLSRSSLQWQSNFVEYVDQYYCHDPHSNGSQILWSMWTNITVTILTPMAVKFCGVCGPILLSRSSLQWQSNFVEYVDQYYCHDPHSNGSQILWSMWDQYYCHDPHSNGSQILWSMWTNITVTILTPMAVKFCRVCGPILLS